jgi:hypothetical protein
LPQSSDPIHVLAWASPGIATPGAVDTLDKKFQRIAARS